MNVSASLMSFSWSSAGIHSAAVSASNSAIRVFSPPPSTLITSSVIRAPVRAAMSGIGTGIAATVEARHGWVIPSAWRFISEVWAYERKPVSEVVYEHENDDEIQIIRE